MLSYSLLWHSQTIFFSCLKCFIALGGMCRIPAVSMLPQLHAWLPRTTDHGRASLNATVDGHTGGQLFVEVSHADVAGLFRARQLRAFMPPTLLWRGASNADVPRTAALTELSRASLRTFCPSAVHCAHPSSHSFPA